MTFIMNQANELYIKHCGSRVYILLAYLILFYTRIKKSSHKKIMHLGRKKSGCAQSCPLELTQPLRLMLSLGDYHRLILSRKVHLSTLFKGIMPTINLNVLIFVANKVYRTASTLPYHSNRSGKKSLTSNIKSSSASPI